MNLKSAAITLILLMALTLTGCSGSGLFAPTATPTATPTPEPSSTPIPTDTPAPTATNTPAPTDTPRPTPTDFPVSLLPGYFAFMAYYDCPDMSLTCIGVSRVDGTDMQILSEFTYGMAVEPGWSPDGRYIVYKFFALGGTGIYELRVYDFVRNAEITISPDFGEGFVKSYSWSPDSTNLVISFTDGGSNEIDLQILNLQKRNMVNLTNSPGVLEDNPAWSPNGDLIAFSSDEGGSTDIWVISPQGNGLLDLTGSEDDTWSDRLPSWSPEGNRIAFFRFDGEANGLWLMNDDGTNQRLLFDMGSARADEPPVWSYDGIWIAIIIGNNDSEDVWLVDPYYGDAIQLNEQKGDFSKVSWSPDSIALIYNQNLTTGNTQLNLEVIGVEWPFHMDMETSIESFVWSPVSTLP